ncbi:MAG TPA: cell envelope biogenesis protein TolA, partial [Allosphingosinicella sp.]|nr:cell envelope biogenesis protein TolA [Allosphingosinicella sp.]
AQAARPQPRPAPPARRPLNLDPRSFGNDAAARATTPPAAAMSARAAADIASAIARQVQPCADRQVYPGPGSERIVTPIMLSLNPDGSLKGRPRVGQQRGIDDENRRYAQRVADLAVNAFVSCSPLRGLPPELYDVPRGWSNFTLNYRLPG